MKEELYKIHVTGKVQGVFFRKYTQEKARKLGLNGSVKNEKDGSVYIEVKGPEKDILALIDWCKEGSPEARVDNVSYHRSDQGTTYSSFNILR